FRRHSGRAPVSTPPVPVDDYDRAFGSLLHGRNAGSFLWRARGALLERQRLADSQCSGWNLSGGSGDLSLVRQRETGRQGRLIKIQNRRNNSFLKSLIHKVTGGLARLSHYLISLGPFGLFAIAFLDSVLVPMPGGV